MSRRLPPLAAIRCFEAAARLGSFTRAGAELGMTQAAVSYQIKLLEERIGASLFRRGPRGVETSAVGAALAPRVTRAFEDMRDAFEAVSDRVAGTLVIDSVPTFAMNWLASRLGDFQLRHPELAVRLATSARLVDFERDEADAAIRCGSGQWPGLVVHRLFPMNFTPMIGRAFADATPLLQPADLLDLPLLDRDDPWWTDWFTQAGVDPTVIAEKPGLSVEMQAMAARAAIAGQGVAILTPAFFREEIAAGLLVQPFPLVLHRGQHYCLVYPESRRQSPRIRAFRDWLLAATAADGRS